MKKGIRREKVSNVTEQTWELGIVEVRISKKKPTLSFDHSLSLKPHSWRVFTLLLPRFLSLHSHSLSLSKSPLLSSFPFLSLLLRYTHHCGSTKIRIRNPNCTLFRCVSHSLFLYPTKSTPPPLVRGLVLLCAMMTWICLFCCRENWGRKFRFLSSFIWFLFLFLFRENFDFEELRVGIYVLQSIKVR